MQSLIQLQKIFVKEFDFTYEKNYTPFYIFIKIKVTVSNLLVFFHTLLLSYHHIMTFFNILYFFSDYDLGGVLFSNAYHIGGQFVGGVGWQWVDGTPVDPSLLNSYSILGVDGDCLFWDSLYLLIQDKCDTSERILCEQVPPVI